MRLLYGYVSYMAAGAALLCLPFAQQGPGNSLVDNVFSAVSAVSTTGLVTVGTGSSYSLFGQIVIVCLIQLGGLGYMTLGSFFVLSRRTPLDDHHHSVNSAAFSLPPDFEVAAFVRRIVIYTLGCEAVGAVAFFVAFDGVERRLWTSIFHSVSAFCTAGFSTLPSGLEPFRDDAAVNIVALTLAFLGAIGFIVMSDVVRSVRSGTTTTTLTTRIILVFTLVSTAVGSALIFFTDDGIRSLPGPERYLASFFQAGTALSTVGFNTHPIGELAAAPIMLMFVLMIVGASPSGTGGGLKSTSVSATVASVWSTVRARDHVTFLGRRVPPEQLRLAFASLGLYVGFAATGSFALLLSEAGAFEDIVFEALSAQGTVGLSRGLTGDLTGVGKGIIMALMFIGRLGPVTFAVALLSTERSAESDPELDDLVI